MKTNFRHAEKNVSKVWYRSGAKIIIIESVDSISRDERDSPQTQYITNARIFYARYAITHFKHYHRVLQRFPIE